MNNTVVIHTKSFIGFTFRTFSLENCRIWETKYKCISLE